jgi:hypothetical protein
MTRESRQEFDSAVIVLRSKSEYDFSWFWDGGDAQAWYDLARAAAVMNRNEEALEYLLAATGCGWRDRDMLVNDECVSRLAQHPSVMSAFSS